MDKRYIPIAKVELSEGEIKAALKALKSGRLIQGEKVDEFERAFAEKVGARYGVAVSSGTAALHIAYLALINPGYEVIVPAFTHISTASMVHFAGGRPVFCDIDPQTFTVDVVDLRRKIGERTTAIAPVHLFGNACDIEEILDIAEKHALKIVWDAAQAHGTKYRGQDVGSFNDLVCYSFYPTKNMITGEGGMITMNNPQLYKKCRLLRSHGQEKKYFHASLGLNYRMTELEAAIGIEQLKELDRFIDSRRKNAEYLTDRLSAIEGIMTPHIKDGVDHSFHQYSILIDRKILNCSRDELSLAIEKEGVATAIHYPRPLHKQPVFSANNVSLPVSEETAQHILSLPVHPWLSKEDLDFIVEAIKISVAKCISSF